MRVCAFDPGITTGYTVGHLEESDGILYLAPKQKRFDHLTLYDYLVKEQFDYIVYESFEFRNKVRTGTVLISLEYIGVIRLFCAQYKIPHTNQTASEAGAGGKTGYFNNDKLKSKQVYIPGRPHAMDSLRHLLKWYEFGKGFKFNTKKGYRLV